MANCGQRKYSERVIRVMIVDDQALFRAGLASLLESVNIAVVAQCGDAEQALWQVERCHPDVVLMDQRMPNVGGAECTRRLLARWPDLSVIALTTFDDEPTVFEALRAGAVGYLLKDADAAELIAAIERVAQGGSVVTDSVLPMVLRGIREGRHAVLGQTAHGLSEREVEVLRQLVAGHSNKQIGGQLHIAEGTVKNHLTNIFEKLGVKDRTSAALRARDLGLDHGQ